MKKPIIFSVFFFILTAISSFGQGVWIEERVDPDGLRTGIFRINGKVHSISPFGSLRGADLTGADLRNANLQSTELRETIFVGANLTGADFFQANLREANLREANLTGARLALTHLIAANLTGADLTGADLAITGLLGADLTGADLTGADLYRANLRRADLRGAILIGADLEEARLFGANLTETNLTETNLTGTKELANAITEVLPDGKDQRIVELETQLAEYQNGRAGSIVIDSSNGEASISFNMEESEDLKTWQKTGEKITKTIQLKDGKKFYRFALDK